MKKIIFIFYFFFKFLVLFINPSYSLIALNCDDTISTDLTIQQTCQDNDTLTITNEGSVVLTGSNAIDADSHSGVTIDNKGTISASVNQAIDMQHGVNTTVTNSGTIEATLRNAILMDGNEADNNTINNSGTLKAGKKQVILATNSENTTIINSGTIETTNSSNPNTGGINYYNTSGSAINGATITNSGTIFAYGTAIRFGTQGIASKAVNNMTITNSGTIEGGTASIAVHNANATGTNIITKDDGTYIGAITLNDTETTFTLDCSISKDQDIELSDKTNITITNNLCGNDTYQILDANKNLDSDNSETNGYLRIYGEELDLISNNKKYRTEIFNNNIDHIFKSLSDDEEISTFYSTSKRDNVYSNSVKGISGYQSNNDLNNDKTQFFLTYLEQNTNFNSKEKSKSEYFAIGYDLETKFQNLSIRPLFGVSSNQIDDIETESGQLIRNNFLGQFFAINSEYKFNREFGNNNQLSLKLKSNYAAQRLGKYRSNFTHGDLFVGNALDQAISAGLNLEYLSETNKVLVLNPYIGLSLNKALSKDIKFKDINGAGLEENLSKSHAMNGHYAKTIGLKLNKKFKNFGISLNIEHKNQNELIDNNINIMFRNNL